MKILSDAPPESITSTTSVDQPSKQLITAGRTKVSKIDKSQNVDTERIDESNPFTKRQKVEAYLRQRFRFQYNELTGGVEYKITGRTDFTEMNNYRLNSLCRQIDFEQGLSISPRGLFEYLKSDFVPLFHPLKHYFDTLPTVQGTEAIQQLAATVTVPKPDLFKLALTRWLVATIANIYNEGCQNHTCLVLTGGQGAFKTTWLNLLCPPILDKYRYCGKIDLKSKDTLILLATHFIINLDDQLKSLNNKDSETVKTLITHQNVTVRRPYDAVPSYLTRVASFCGSINGNEFLSDSTGSRRFLPFEVEQIDIEAAQKLDYDLVWAEAYNLYQTGFQYWFTKEETNELFEGNEKFQVRTPEYEMLHQYYDVVKDRAKANVRYSTTALLNKLQNFTRIPLNLNKLGNALTQSGGINKTSRADKGAKVWWLYERTAMDMERDLESENAFDS